MVEAVVVLSGGMDSATALYLAIAEMGVDHVAAITFDYGQRHYVEINAAKRLAKEAGIVDRHKVVNMGWYGRIAESSLTGKGEIPEGHYEHESMKQTVVPNRNMTMISIAAAMAISLKAKYIYVGVHAGDHAIYPDCRPQFIEAVGQAILEGNYDAPTIFAPFLQMSKAQIVAKGIELKVPYELTWSCYKGADFRMALQMKPCGKCGTCVERLEAFKLNGLEDPLEYRL